MNAEKKREWRVTKPKLENIINGIRESEPKHQLVKPCDDVRPSVQRLSKGYMFIIPIRGTYADEYILGENDEHEQPVVYGSVSPNKSGSSWHIVDAGIYVPKQDSISDSLENGHKNRLLYSVDKMFQIPETIGKEVGARRVSTEPIPEEHDFKAESLLDQGYIRDSDGSYTKFL